MRGDRKSELVDTIQKLNQRIIQLEHVVSQLSRPVIEHVTIERVYLQNPVLERLEFGLENIDIKELSGALNLGNNFGVNVEQLKNQKQEQEKASQGVKEPIQKQTEVEQQIERVVNNGTSGYTKEKTASGYRFTVHRKREK